MSRVSRRNWIVLSVLLGVLWAAAGLPRIVQAHANTAMPAFEGRLDEGERWDVINYLRTLAGKP